MLSFISRYDYHLLNTNSSSGSIYFCGCFEYRWWNYTTTQGIFHYYQYEGLYGDQGGSQLTKSEELYIIMMAGPQFMLMEECNLLPH